MRQATLSDIDTIVAIGRSIAQEARPLPHAFEDEACARWLRTVLPDPTIVGWIEEVEGETRGFALGGLGQTAYAPGEVELRIEYIWVHPEHRKTRIALRLALSMMSWGIARGAKLMYMSSTTGADLSGLAKLLGAAECGQTFMKVLQNGRA
jgi:GNAT superfamily N-acetyltransferase